MELQVLRTYVNDENMYFGPLCKLVTKNNKKTVFPFLQFEIKFIHRRLFKGKTKEEIAQRIVNLV